jgi:amidophosphoribosyltransferase
MANPEHLLNLDLRDKCGVSGAYSPEGHAPYLVYKNEKSLQHRGQDGFGIAAHERGSRNTIQRVRRLGKIVIKDSSGEQVGGMFDEEARIFMPHADLAIGHNWYSTSNGKGDVENVQPFVPAQSGPNIAVAHNGNFNEQLLWHVAHEYGVETTARNRQSMSDSRVYAETLGKAIEKHGHIEPAFHSLLPLLEDSAFSLSVLTEEGLYAVRDRNGIRYWCTHNIFRDWRIGRSWSKP